MILSPSCRILRGDALELLRALPDASVQVCVTSPPYYGLRQYLKPDHPEFSKQIGLEAKFDCLGWARGERCGDCFICRLTAVFSEVRRVLRKDGTLWLNIGDSYSSGGRETQVRDSLRDAASGKHAGLNGIAVRPGNQDGIKAKDLMLVPERLALSLQAGGWYLRSRIIWEKTAPMPESVTDRPTKSHEHIWLLSKSERYYYDSSAAKEPAVGISAHDLTGCGYDAPGQTAQRGNRVKVPSGWDTGPGAHGTIHRDGRTLDPEYTDTPLSWKGSRFDDGKNAEVHPNVGKKRSGNKARKPASARGVPVYDNGSTNGAVAGSVPWEGLMRNWRDVWPIGPEPFRDAHFATFPSEIPRRAIVAGSRPGDTVLDPFAGSGTTLAVANALGRNAIGIELNDAYTPMIERRTRVTVGLPLEIGS